MNGSPRILAFDTSGPHCAAVLLMGDSIAASRHAEMERGQAELLFPMLDEVLTEASLAWHDLEAIGVGTGPGNFTGLRVAVSAARGLALSLEIPAIGVSSFEVARRCGALSHAGTIHLPAPREATYAQDFGSEGPVGPPRLVQDAQAQPIDLDWSGPALHALARIAAERVGFGAARSRPVPLYIRAADAAPAADPPPAILP